MRAWLAARRERNERLAREEGFNWAAGTLLKTGDIELVEGYVSIFGDGSAFDKGVVEAIEAWRNTP